MGWTLGESAPLGNYTDWTSEQLAEAIASLTAEAHRRAVADADPDAITAQTFATAFTAAGEPGPPTVTPAGLLICPGAKLVQSSRKHKCTFITVDGEWVWNHPDAIHDTMRTADLAGRHVIQSVTLIPLAEGAIVEQVSSQAASGPCRVRRTDTYTYTGSQLRRTSTSTRPGPGAHR